MAKRMAPVWSVPRVRIPGKATEAATLRNEFESEWQYSDITITRSVF